MMAREPAWSREERVLREQGGAREGRTIEANIRVNAHPQRARGSRTTGAAIREYKTRETGR